MKQRDQFLKAEFLIEYETLKRQSSMTSDRDEQSIEEQYQSDLLVSKFTNFDEFKRENLCKVVNGIFCYSRERWHSACVLFCAGYPNLRKDWLTLSILYPRTW